MDNVTNPTQHTSHFKVIRTLGIEVGIIVVLTVIVVAILNLFHVIDLSSLFATPNTQKGILQQASQQPQQQSNANPANNIDPKEFLGQPNLQLITKNKALKAAQNIIVFQGVIDSVDTASGFDKTLNASYSARVVVGVGTGTDKLTLLYPQQTLDKIKVVNQSKQTITLKELKKGDKVSVRTNTGIFRKYPDSINQVEYDIIP